jgi:hypothetical protein
MAGFELHTSPDDDDRRLPGVSDPASELAVYFQDRAKLPDRELVRLTRAARAGGRNWAAIAAVCGVRQWEDTDGIAAQPSGRIPRTSAELLFRATQYSVVKLTGSRAYPPLT